MRIVRHWLYAPIMTLMAAGVSFADTIRPGFDGNTLAANDDSSTGVVSLGFSGNFFGVNFTQGFVNNNGNLTFGQPLSTFTPFNLASTSRQIIAPFFADVDTRGNGSGLTRYGTGTVDGHNAFGVNWLSVGYYNSRTDKLNSFQLVLVERADTGAGNFDIEFNYRQIQWETGNASAGTNGLGGNSARAGYSNGSGLAGTQFEIAGSAINGAFLDGGPNSLVTGSNINEPGRFLFAARNGAIDPTPTNAVPAPPAMVLMLLAAPALWLRRRKA